MGGMEGLEIRPMDGAIESGGAPGAGMEALGSLLSMPRAPSGPEALTGVVVGELVALLDDGAVALVTFPGQSDTAAVRARTVVPLRGPHIGRPVVLVFERGDPRWPIVMGLVQGAPEVAGLAAGNAAVVDVDGDRLTVSAQRELVLRCGKASITLTSVGKVLIHGTYVQSRSTGVNQVKGGSIQLN